MADRAPAVFGLNRAPLSEVSVAFSPSGSRRAEQQDAYLDEETRLMNAKKAKTQAPVHADQTVSQALTEILAHNFQYLLQWEEAARSWHDIEGVHQMRVTFRRMRSVLSSFRTAVPKEVSEYWSEELGWLASQLGMARDLDVFIDEGLGAVWGKLPLPGQEKMLALAETHRAKAYEQVREMLDGERYARMKRDFPEWFKSAAWEKAEIKDKVRKKLDLSVTAFSRKLLDRLERRVLEAGTDVDKYDAPQMHRLRIECKKLRYGAEFFAPITPGLDVFIGHMKGLQDLLGIMNDVSVMEHLLELLLEGQSDPDVLRYSGGLVGWRTRQYYELLDGFEDRWQEFIHAKHPWWHKHGHHREGD